MGDMEEHPYTLNRLNYFLLNHTATSQCISPHDRLYLVHIKRLLGSCVMTNMLVSESILKCKTILHLKEMQ